MRITRAYLVVLAVVAAVLAGTSWPHAQALTKVTINYPTRSGASWPLFLAKEGGYYQKYGLDVDLVGPRGLKAASGWTITGETAEHISLLSLKIIGTDFDGNPFDIEQTYGKKSALTTFTCTQHFEEDGAIVDVTAVAGVVPPQ